MEPLTIATTYATIVGLICNYRSERRASAQDDYHEFLQWINKQRHQELIDELNSNSSLVSGVKILLADNHDQIMAKLKALESSMAAVSSHINGLKEISLALAPNQGLSDQAYSIINQLDESGGSHFMELNNLAAHTPSYQIMDGNGNKAIEIEDTRFIDDDLNQLCNLGLLIPDETREGNRIFRITRTAVNLTKASKF